MARTMAIPRASRDETANNLVPPHSDEVEAWMMTFVNADQPYRRSRRNYNLATLEFQELSRGLYL